MDEILIKNWNDKVTSGDTVYHLGDFCFGNNPQEIIPILNGNIIMIQGNHDKGLKSHKHRFMEYHNGFREIKIDEIPITLCHYAMRVWNKSHHGAFHLYGHSHNSLPDDPHSLSFDVGVDANNFFPVSWEEVKERMNKKTFKPVDHHQ